MGKGQKHSKAPLAPYIVVRGNMICSVHNEKKDAERQAAWGMPYRGGYFFGDVISRNQPRATISE